jgi:hypothetical protein|tara:strand:+ start:205 stop:618 length:414 start_codon:yes stop_codon:yes gene_type:complete
MNTQLLCTFTDIHNLNITIDLIIECNDIFYNKVYVLSNIDDPKQLMCTYNIPKSDDFLDGVKNTISLHRKKHSNTLYTINALNTLIRKLNNGVLDKTFSIEWDDYKNCILLFDSENSIQRINTKLYKIIDIDNIENN